MGSYTMTHLYNGIYNNKTVLVTGHTGFKGSWLCLWLTNMGAKVIGYSLPPNTKPNHYEMLNLDMISVLGDIRDKDKLNSVFEEHQPDVVFHLAAQPLVRLSYKEPVDTFEINAMGTINVYEACRNSSSVKAIINITSDKCYENKEWMWGYRENDAMGGYDPYSASKGCAELITSSYRNSFFNLKDYGISHNILLASCRAGNVTGGADWSEDRLIPDIMKAVADNKKVFIRNPNATRPWQHVLEPLNGYLHVGQKLLEGKKSFAEGWNFGPSDDEDISVEHVVKNIKKCWNKFDYEISQDSNQPYEATLLKLDCTKARSKLKWKDLWNFDITFEKTVNWYREFYENSNVISQNQLENYIKEAKNKKLEWAK